MPTWIKITERNPDTKIIDTYFVKQRVKDSNEDWFPGVCTFSGDWEIDDMYEVLEWLENPDESLPGDGEKEIERLKGLVEKAHKRGWVDSAYIEETPFANETLTYNGSWQQFKTDNQL